MYSTTVKSVVEQFDARQGNDAIQVNGFLVFSNGARRDTDPMGPLIEPPEDPHERAKIQVRYFQEKVKRLSGKFNSLKEGLVSTARFALGERFPGSPPVAADEAVKQLEELQQLVHAARKRLDEVRAEVEATTPQRIREKQARAVAAREENERFLSAVVKVNI